MKILKCILYWIVQLTWGSLMTIVGLLVTAFCIVFLKGKPHKNGFSYIVEIGGNWGGLELGAVALCGGYTTTCPNQEWFEHTRRHEFGHSLQNLIFGPFTLFVVWIPSVIRYHYQNYRSRKGLPNKPYDQAIYEYTASKWGYYAVNKLEGTNLEYTFKRK